MRLLQRLSALVLVMPLLLASCGTPEPSQSPSPSPSNPDEPVLTTRNITLTVWESESAAEFIRQASAEFQKKYPNISFEIEAVEPDTAASRFRGAVTATPAYVSKPPDLIAVPHTDIRALAETFDVLPARNQEKAEESAQAACVQAATVDGVIYGYPVSASTIALFYNKDLIAAPPATWEGVAGFSAEFGGQYGFIFPAGTAYYAVPFTTLGNTRLFGSDGENAANSFLQSPPSIAGMEAFAALRSVLDVPAAELTVDATVRAFASGNAAMCIAGTWDIGAFSGVNYGVAPLPAFGDENGMGAAAPIDARVMLVSAWSEHADEASAFADFLLTPAMQRLRLTLTGEIPSVKLTVGSPAYAAGLIKQLENAFAAPTIPEAEAFWNGFGAIAASIWDGASPAEILPGFNASIITPEIVEPSPEG